ncbi:MAG: HAMP domain-containing histidine kinase [Chloroherpetonaceae bacterium]|nr:HAMP domain-containing histidine kinase [Chloroherpetonaceae bacterium]MDW8438520.1 HAMP domain-containing sensor histidine kinase [Chloroherpetonaceae bacterium]
MSKSRKVRADKSQRKKARLERMFKSELQVAERAAKMAQDSSLDRNALAQGFENLLREYNALLQQAQTLTNIGDAAQRKLLKTQAELERLNAETRKLYEEAQSERARAEEANRLKSELLSVVAHDLKNPLQAIMGFAQLLAMKPNEPDMVRKCAQRIEANSNRMLELIGELLKSMRYEFALRELRRERCDIGALLSIVAQNNAARIALKNQSCHLELAPDCFALVDAARMQEVFDNLLSNAIKYSPIGKPISVLCKKTLAETMNEARVLVAVKDEGQGLTEDDKAKLFGQFQRLSAQPTASESSTGLGLFIVKQIVELHEGKVWAESEGRDKGATFFVELPAAP